MMRQIKGLTLRDALMQVRLDAQVILSMHTICRFSLRVIRILPIIVMQVE